MENIWKVVAMIIMSIVYVALGYNMHIPTVVMCILAMLINRITIKIS